MQAEDRRHHFQAVHAQGRDFWNDPDSSYEAEKRLSVLSALHSARYSSVLEIGCSTGLTSEKLAERADRFLGLDLSETAILLTRLRLCLMPHAWARTAEVPACWPTRQCDLILLSEMLYYLSPDELTLLAARCAGSLMPGGEIVVVCYLGDTQTPLSGQQAADIFVGASRSQRPYALTTHSTDGRPYLHQTLRAE